MERPYMICHMIVSLDGKVTGDFLSHPAAQQGIEEYYRINRQWPCGGFACGRVTMEESFTGGVNPPLEEFSSAKETREDYIAVPIGTRIAVAFDRKGRLGWRQSTIEDADPGYGGAHIVEVLCEQASDAYLAYLKRIGISYIFAGTDEMDLPLALLKLRESFGLNVLLLEGGSLLNSAFAKADLIDELSLVVVPLSATGGDKPLFEDKSQK
ncbi:MAG: dihydrofolate reductase family protein, partial [Christensenellaceae bacterium]|nr:dihydrofolate reductase family protein [Christensenellaceae bacterium]